MLPRRHHLPGAIGLLRETREPERDLRIHTRSRQPRSFAERDEIETAVAVAIGQRHRARRKRLLAAVRGKRQSRRRIGERTVVVATEGHQPAQVYAKRGVEFAVAVDVAERKRAVVELARREGDALHRRPGLPIGREDRRRTQRLARAAGSDIELAVASEIGEHEPFAPLPTRRQPRPRRGPSQPRARRRQRFRRLGAGPRRCGRGRSRRGLPLFPHRRLRAARGRLRDWRGLGLIQLDVEELLVLAREIRGDAEDGADLRVRHLGRLRLRNLLEPILPSLGIGQPFGLRGRRRRRASATVGCGCALVGFCVPSCACTPDDDDTRREAANITALHRWRRDVNMTIILRPEVLKS